MALNIKPLADRVLVEPMEAETKTASGIIFQIMQKKNRKRELLLLLAMAKKTNL